MKDQYDNHLMKDSKNSPYLDSNKSRNRRSVFMNLKDNKILLSIPKKEDNLNNDFEKGTSLFLNDLIKDDNSVLKTDNSKNKKKTTISNFEDIKNNFLKTYYSSKNKKEELIKDKIIIKAKSPKDNRNSPFKKKLEIIKKLNLDNQLIKDKILKERN